MSDLLWRKEPVVAEAIGLPVAELKKLRARLVEEADYRRSGKEVVYSPSGEKKAAAAAAGEAVAVEGGTFEDLVVVKVPINPRAVIVALKKTGAAAGACRVRNSRLYVPGMVLVACRWIGKGQWAFDGKPPRRKGVA